MDMTSVGTMPFPPTIYEPAPDFAEVPNQRRMTSSLDTVSYKPRKKFLFPTFQRRNSETVTLQEFFTLTLESESEVHRECIRACKGLSLKEAVAQFFSTRGLSINNYDFYIEGSASALPLDVDTLPLAGIVVKMKCRHSSPGSPQREDPKGVVLRQARERKGDKRNSAGEKLDRFNEILNGLTTGNATPRVCEKESCQSYEDFCEEGHSMCLEENWQQVVKNNELLSKKESAQQSAVWELLSTEINYMRILKSVIDVYARPLVALQKREEPFLNEIVYHNLFSNVEDIYKANATLWVTHMSQVLEFSRKTGNTLNPSLLKDTFKEMPDIFKPYVEFCKATDACQRYLQHQKENNQLFGAFLQWADNQILNDLRVREGLKAHLTKPMQRLTRYKVILMRIRDETVDEQVRWELQEMVDTVDNFVTRVNNEVAVKQKKEKLQDIQKKIGPYDCVEAPGDEYTQFVSKYSGFKVKTPMQHNQEPREILMEGHLKMKEGQTRWTEVYCYLFTDLFLICKTSKRSHTSDKASDKGRMRVIKPPMRLDMIKMHLVNSNTPSQSLALVHLTEFDCLANLYAFTEDSQKLEQWFTKFNEAYKSYLDALAGIRAEEPLTMAGRYTRTCSVQSEQLEKDRRRSSTIGSGSNIGSAPSLTSPLVDPRGLTGLAALSRHHYSHSHLRRCPIEASPLSREASVTSSAPSVTSPNVPSSEGSPRRLPRTPLSSVYSAEDAILSKKRYSLGNQGNAHPASGATGTAPVMAAGADKASALSEAGSASTGHSASLESFRSSSGVSSVDSGHAFSGSELSNVSSRAITIAGTPVGLGGTDSSSSTLNGEKLTRYASVSSLSASEDDDDDVDGISRARPPPFVDQGAASSIRVVDKRFCRSLNDLSLHSLTVAPTPDPSQPPSPSNMAHSPKRRAPLPPTHQVQQQKSKLKGNISPEAMRILLIEGSDAEATSV